MIKYKRGGKWHFLNLFRTKGSLFPASFAVAGPCAVITCLLKMYNVFGPESVLLNTTVWSGFSSLVGFLVIFRTSEAYSRFWDGCTATHQMRAEWIDAASAIMSFCHYSNSPKEDIMKFKQLAVRLFSLLHAMALGQIEECEDLEDVMAFNLELIDPSGLDAESWRALKECHNKVTLVFTWLQSLIVENIKTGVLAIPPPILSRVFQELANGMVALHEAQKISNIPFPFPYAQTCDLLLFCHWMVTPVVTVQWCANPWSAAIFGFLQVFILWSLNNIAVEIEHPFGDDLNDLDAAGMQMDMNMNLLLVLHPASTRTPTLSDEAQLTGLTRLGKKVHHSPKAAFNPQGTYNEVIISHSNSFKEASGRVPGTDNSDISPQWGWTPRGSEDDLTDAESGTPVESRLSYSEHERERPNSITLSEPRPPPRWSVTYPPSEGYSYRQSEICWDQLGTVAERPSEDQGAPPAANLPSGSSKFSRASRPGRGTPDQPGFSNWWYRLQGVLDGTPRRSSRGSRTGSAGSGANDRGSAGSGANDRGGGKVKSPRRSRDVI